MTELPHYFEELEAGDRYEVDGTYEVTREEIVEFASRYDPQPFHVDEEAAEESMFGGLVASGWHTCAMAMRLLVEGYLADSGGQGAIGVDDLRWHRPVRPGDTLALETEVVDTDDWSDDAGLVHSRVELYADGDLAMSYVGLVLFERREG